MEPYRWSARITSRVPSPPTGTRSIAEAYVRKHRFAVGAPLQFDREDPRVSALEYVLGAFGADLVNGFHAVARERRIPLETAEAVVNAELENPLTTLGVIGEEGTPRIRRIAATVYANVSTDGEEAARDAWTESLRRSPLAVTLGDAVELAVELKLSA